MRKKAVKVKRKPAKKEGKCWEVNILDQIGAQPDQPLLSESGGDSVRFTNSTGRGHTLEFRFDTWPFLEPPQFIQLDPGKKSAKFHISPQTPTLVPIPYKIQPPVEPPPNKPGPGDPSVIGDN